MPLQLLELAVIIPRAFSKMFFTRTPRGRSHHSLFYYIITHFAPLQTMLS